MAIEQIPSPRLQVAFRVDASLRMGGGHVMRCLTLAECLIGAGAEVTFVAAAITDPLRALVRSADIRLVEIGSSSGDISGDHDWDRTCLPLSVQRADAERTIAQLAGVRCDWLIVDHYGLDIHWEAAMRPRVGRVAVIDDLANRSHDCELLLDQTYGRGEADYRPLTRADTELLVGAHYALLRPEFAAGRSVALARHLAPRSVERILISLGMTDVGALTEVAARAALAVTDAEIDIVLGSVAPTLAAIRTLADERSRVTLHVDTAQICDLMVSADLAIGAAGTTSWERCCLGLPAITFAIASNQRLIAAMLAEAGAVHLIDAPDAGAIERAIRALSADNAGRRRLAEISAAVCDGKGAARVASRILA